MYCLSYKDIVENGIDKDKKVTQPYFDRFIYRPIANLVCPFLFNSLKLTPNKISIVSILFTFLGFIFISLGSQSLVIFGLGFLFVWIILDCADGSIARSIYYKYNIVNPLGDFFDGFAGYFMVAGLWFSFGIMLFNQSYDVSWIVLGAISSLSALYARVSYIKLIHTISKIDREVTTQDSRKSALFFVYENLEFGGLLIPLLFVAVWFNFVGIVLIIYLTINLAMILWLFLFVYKKAKKYKRI